MSKQKLPVAVISFLFFFIGGSVGLLVVSQKALADGKPVWCGSSKEEFDNMSIYNEKTNVDWQNCCAGTYDDIKCHPEKATATDTSTSSGSCPEGYEVTEEGGCALRGNESSYSDYSDTSTSTSSSSKTSSSSGGSLGDLSGLAGTTGLPNPSGGIKGIVDRVLNWMLGIFGALALLAFLISGIMYLTAAGDTTKAENAKKAMVWSIIGVVVGLGGVIVLQTIDYLLR